MSGDESVSYYVKHDDGDVQRLSLEQLDVAFQAGFIDADTRVLASDGTGWTTLGSLAGLDEPVAPVRPRAPSRTAIAPGPVPPMPVIGRSPAAYAPTARAFVAAPLPYQPPPLPSHRPVSVDLGVLDAPGQSQGYASQPSFAPKGRSKWGWAVGIAGIAILGAAATVAARQPAWAESALGRLGIHSGAQAAAAAQVQWPAATAEAASTPPPAANPSPEPQVPAVTAAVPVPPPVDTHVEDVNANGRTGKGPRAPRSKTHRAAPAASRPRTAAKKGSSSFTTGGNKFDPLNSSI
jgi:hypothetical protein